MNDDIAIEDGDPDIGVDIEDELLNTLRTTLPQNRNVSFVLAAKDSEGCLIGGLTAHASYGWLLIKTLWVAEAFRHRGLGRRFVTQAEERARSLGCHGAWLDTSNPEAMRFYAKLNYECFGQLANQADQPPSSHRRWFLQKQL
ncbi:MAG: GNAT family N-acetyltransferase [Pseudomonadota bacterium]